MSIEREIRDHVVGPPLPGKCACGCGQQTSIRKGRRNTFVRGHNASTIDPVASFWSQVPGTQSPDHCWEWSGSRTLGGYGTLSFRRRRVYAHRLSVTLAGIDVPEGMVVMHSCDNPPCVNPAHLRVGTQEDNVRDKVEKGRHYAGVRPMGSEHHAAKLAEEDVREMRRNHRPGDSRRALAAKYGVSSSAIDAVLDGRKWRHVA